MFAIGVLVFDHSLGLFGWVLSDSPGPSFQLPGPKLRGVLAVRQSVVGLWRWPPICQHIPSALGDLGRDQAIGAVRILGAPIVQRGLAEGLAQNSTGN